MMSYKCRFLCEYGIKYYNSYSTGITVITWHNMTLVFREMKPWAVSLISYCASDDLNNAEGKVEDIQWQVKELTSKMAGTEHTIESYYSLFIVSI